MNYQTFNNYYFQKGENIIVCYLNTLILDLYVIVSFSYCITKEKKKYN